MKREIKIKKREIILFDYGLRWGRGRKDGIRVERREREIEWA